MARRRDPQTGKLLMEGIHPVVSERTGAVTYRARQSWQVGGRRQHTSQTFKSAYAAEEWLARLQTEIRRGQAIEPSTVTVADYYAQWYARMVTTWSGSRARTVRMVWERYAEAYFGTMRLQQVTRPVVQRFVDMLVAQGRKPATIRVYMAGIIAMFGDAVQDELIPRSPCVRLVYPAEDARTPETWTPLQMRAFVAKTAKRPNGPLWAYLVATGCRIGEALALHWRDVDLEQGIVHVRRTLSRGPHGYVVRDGTKTSRTGRVVPVDTWMIEVFRAMPRTGELVWHREGEPLSPGTVRAHWDSDVRFAGMPKLTLHGVRHSVASGLILAGVDPRTVADLLGHKTTAMTMEVYTHSSTRSRRDAVRVLGEMMGGDGNPDAPGSTQSVVK